jgi:hypothetical protein
MAAVAPLSIEPDSPVDLTRKSPDARKELLARAIQTQAAQHARVESQC